ncbi:hypothetical protein FLJC2902T_12150 [Flavobacterium limnosediminis JC2902]|uniref:Uncharacterized protein n=1 Tax=Flavobacterium limnosediminis JC2902 TaxID=1341181 RepID=V6SR55_9FLAO|nr:hypothetical protein FLJC2902T_12150 [Flavobacterium limnosediminis JC2902]
MYVTDYQSSAHRFTEFLVKCPKNKWDCQILRKRTTKLTFFDGNPQRCRVAQR